MPDVERQFSEYAATPPPTPGVQSAATASTPSGDGQFTPEPDTGAESGACTTVATESGDSVAEPAIGAVAATKSSGSNGQRPLPERQEGGT